MVTPQPGCCKENRPARSKSETTLAKLFYEGVSELGEQLDAQGAKLRRVA